MHDHSGNQHLKQNSVPVKKVNSSSRKENENRHRDTPSSSHSEDKPKVEHDTIVKNTNLPSTEGEKSQAEILINQRATGPELNPKNHTSSQIETTKPQNTFKLTRESEKGAPSSESGVVGDDFSKKSDLRILCECEPSIAGAAVPTIKSFIPADNNHDSKPRSNKSYTDLSQSDSKEKPDVSQRTKVVPIKNKEFVKPFTKIEEKIKDIEREQKNTKQFKCSQKINQFVKTTVDKLNSEMKANVKKPSLIPKPTRQGISNYKNLDKPEIDKLENVNQSRMKFESEKYIPNPTVKVKEIAAVYSPKNNPKNVNLILEEPLESDALSNANNISSRMIGLQERLKATTSMLRQKIEMDKSKEKVVPQGSCIDLVVEEEINKNTFEQSRKTVDDLYKNIFSLKDIASALSESGTLKNQTKYIEKLFRNISEIKLIADKLRMHDHSKSKQGISDSTTDNVSAEKEKTPKPSSTSAKDNKIYIKFMHSKDRKCDNKKKMRELFTNHSEEAQADPDSGSKLTSESFNSDTCVIEKNEEENKVKETDSMDGVFIPSCEPPKNMEDEEETNGLDITITFPEFSQLLYSNGAESHLSVCLSDISAEALKKLKRCPKDFTLRMDFVEGKVLFQSGRGPANNFQIGPDLKFAENIVDSKKSDVISIKPSTECSFGSQLIPVENARENKSYRSLKSTDSELFNVVSLPFAYQNPYLATNHKSCITFRNDQIMSMAVLAKHIFKSMPQIPSLTNIFEDKIMESPSKTDSRQKTQKPPESEKMD